MHSSTDKDKGHYKEASRFFKVSARYGGPSDLEPVYAVDETRGWNAGILCDPSKMHISEWCLRPIYDGVPEILVGSPVCLWEGNSAVVACGNCDTTGTLREDVWVDRVDGCPFASAAQIGTGFAVLIAGRVSGDAWHQQCSHNTKWLTNLASFLVETANADRMRRLSHRRSPHLVFLSHRSTDKTMVSEIGAAIKSGGVNIWLDREQLVPSQSLSAEISRALGNMTHFVLFWSEHCVGAPWVERELTPRSRSLLRRKSRSSLSGLMRRLFPPSLPTSSESKPWARHRM